VKGTEPGGPVAAARAAWSFLTVLGGAAAPHRHAPAWFGAVGSLSGGMLGGAWWALDQVVPAPVAAAGVVALDAALTGMLHLDGLADSADGLLAPMARERRLTIMRTPDVGAFAVVLVVLALVLRTVSLASLPPRPLLCVGLWALARGAMAATMAGLPYARPEGLATAFGSEGAVRVGAISGIGIGAVALACVGRAGALAAAGALVGAAAVGGLARRRLGGYTGDVLGAVVVVAETFGLIAATATVR